MSVSLNQAQNYTLNAAQHVIRGCVGTLTGKVIGELYTLWQPSALQMIGQNGTAFAVIGATVGVLDRTPNYEFTKFTFAFSILSGSMSLLVSPKAKLKFMSLAGYFAVTTSVSLVVRASLAAASYSQQKLNQ